MKVGQPTNAKKHLNEKHLEKLKEIDAAEEAKKEVSVPILHCYFFQEYQLTIPSYYW